MPSVLNFMIVNDESLVYFSLVSQFVLDVHDFIEGGNISVNVVDEMELVVEGQVDREAGDSKSSNHFLRRFVLPKDVELESVSSVMSSDGVLTVIAPKKVK